MIVYTYSEARQNLAQLLEQALTEGEIKIRRKDGRIFVVRPEPKAESPLDVAGLEVDITTDEIVALVRESRAREYTTLEKPEPTSPQIRPSTAEYGQPSRLQALLRETGGAWSTEAHPELAQPEAIDRWLDELRSPWRQEPLDKAGEDTHG